jgi:hypothetical protein
MPVRSTVLRWPGDYGALDALLLWAPIAVALASVALLVYGAVQQDLRQSANDPQIELAENAAAGLNAGQPVASVLPAERVDLSSGLAPFVVVYDAHGDVLAASATLNGIVPPLPAGVLDAVAGRGEDRITWQPGPGIRIATVIVPYGGTEPGFVLAGRSLRLVEQREDDALREVAAGLAAGLIATLVAALAVTRARRPLHRFFANS